MERPTGMRNRLVVLATVLAFAVAVAVVAVVAGGRDGDGPLEKLSFAASGSAESPATASGSAMAYPDMAATEFRVKGELAELGGEAPAYRLQDTADEAAISKLASRLGLKGDVEDNAAGWTVRDGERELSVARLAGLPWYLSPRCIDTSSSAADGRKISTGCGYGVPGSSGGSSSSMSVAPSRAAVAPATASSPPTSAVAQMCGGGKPGQGEPQCVATEAPTTTAAPGCHPQASCAYSEAEPSGLSPLSSEPPDRPADLPTRAEAERIARDFFGDLGITLDGFEMHDGFLEWRAVVQPHVAGLPALGWAHSVAIGPKRSITSANGFLADPDRIGDYPLAGTAKGLERLKAGATAGWSAYGGSIEPDPAGEVDCSRRTVICDPPPPGTTVPDGTPALAEDMPAPMPAPATTVVCPPEADCSGPDAGASSPPPPTPVPPVAAPAPRQVLTITGVHLALQQFGTGLLPVYVFELEGGGETGAVPAVTDEWVEQNPPLPEPVTQMAPPAPAPAREVPPAMPPPPPITSATRATPVQEGAPATRP